MHLTFLEAQAFLAIERCRSLSKAAEFLFVTQPALTRRLKSLEQRIGYELFIRYKGGKRIELTNEGINFVPIAQKFIMLHEEISELSRESKHTTFTISTMDSVTTCLMPSVYQDFIKESTNTTLNIRLQHSAESYMGIEQGIIDLALIAESQYSKIVELIPAFTEKMIFVSNINAGYPPVIIPSDLDINSCVCVQWSVESDMWFQYWYGGYSQALAVVEGMKVYEMLLLSGKNWTVAPASVANYLIINPFLCVSELSDPPKDRKMYCITDRRKKTEATNLFLNLLNKHIQGKHGIIPLLDF